MVKITVMEHERVVDPVALVERVESPQDTLYAAVQLVLRQSVSGRTAEAVIADRSAIGTELVDGTPEQAGEFGVEVIDVAVRDVVPPGELRMVFAEAVMARQQGLAAIERARAEAAALRALANGAQLLERHPLLASLRAVQLAADSGATVVLDRPSAG